MTTNYNINNVDLDDSPYNFSPYINLSDGNYTNASVLNITARKTVVFGQNALTNTIGNLGNAFNTASVNVPKIDIDEVSVLATMPTAVVFSDTKKSQYYIRGNFALAENNPNNFITLGNTSSRSSPVQVGYLSNWSNFIAVGRDLGIFKLNNLNSQAYDGIGYWGLGRGDNGTFGNNTASNLNATTKIFNIDFVKLSIAGFHSLAIASNGTLWAWGNNARGQLGLNNITNRSVPIQVGDLSVWKELFNARGSSAVGPEHSFAIQSNGTLWAWGSNSYGQLGLGDQTNRSSPVQVGIESYWAKISLGAQHTLALQSNGTLWTWGRNDQSGNSGAQLGLGDRTNRSSPVQVGALSVWTEIACGYGCSLAIQSNSTLWAWGNNATGQLGLSDTTNRSSPVQVGTLSNWAYVSSAFETLAGQSNGTIWAWGRNNGGQLGLGDRTNRSSPLQVGNLSNWAQVRCGYNNTYAIQSNGTLWAWGNDINSQLGNNQTAYYTQPYKITYSL
jgi:alpha-tubulin suppressor-like RCC1 family protein